MKFPFKFTWLKLPPRKWALSVSWPFGGPDAGRDRCLFPGCGVQRKLHGKAHKFVEKEP